MELLNRPVPENFILEPLSLVSNNPTWLAIIQVILKWHIRDLEAELEAGIMSILDHELECRRTWDQYNISLAPWPSYAGGTLVFFHDQDEFVKISKGIAKVRLQQGDRNSWIKARLRGMEQCLWWLERKDLKTLMMFRYCYSS